MSSEYTPEEPGLKIVLLRGSCGNGRTCPNVNISNRSTFVVQGYVCADQDLHHDEAVVEIPLCLVPELAQAGSRAGICLTERGTVLIRGSQVVDPDVLAELDLPAGENAVEVPMSALAELEAAHA